MQEEGKGRRLGDSQHVCAGENERVVQEEREENERGRSEGRIGIRRSEGRMGIRRKEGRMEIRRKEGRMEFRSEGRMGSRRSEGRVGSRPGIFGSSSLEWRMKKLENGGAENLDTRPDALI